jgi:predicted phage terminase large subunit-like protein
MDASAARERPESVASQDDDAIVEAFLARRMQYQNDSSDGDRWSMRTSPIRASRTRSMMIAPADRLPLQALIRSEFELFLAFAYREIGGEGEYMHNWHIDAMIHRLTQTRYGLNRRLIVNAPPRHLKSFVITTAWVAWMLGKNPKLRFLAVSYGYDLAEKHARDYMRIMDSSWYRRAFPNVRLTKRTVFDFETAKGGGRLSSSLAGAITGRGADIIIIDDPMKADEGVYSSGARETARNWMFTTLRNRLNDQETGSIILVMQRLHQADLSGELLDRGGWRLLSLPAIAQHDEIVPLTRGRTYLRRAGNALHPARQSVELLKAIQTEDSFTFAAQYLQAPVPERGNFVDPASLGRYDEPPAGGIVVMSCDTASKDGVHNDWSAIIIARYYRGRHYVLDVCRKRLTFGPLYDKVVELCRHHRVQRLLVEDAASGTALVQRLPEKTPAGVVLPIACRPEGDKVTRFAAQASRIQAGELGSGLNWRTRR